MSDGGVLEATGLSAGHGGPPVVVGVNLRIRPGERWAILGPNGVGKSTLLKTLAGLLPAAAGEVRLHDRALRDWPRRELARHLAWVPQQLHPPEGFLALEWLLLGRAAHLGMWGLAGAADEARAKALLQDLGLAHLAGRPLHTLSGGEQRLLSLARGLFQGGELLLLDEPTASLDLRHQLELLARLKEAGEGGLASVCVLHDLNQAQDFATQALLLGGGRVVAAGPAPEVLEASRLGTLYGVTLERALTSTGRVLFVPAQR